MPEEELILLAHGGGGLRSRELIRELVLRRLSNPVLDRLDDAACLPVPGFNIAFTTDSYVVDPLFFPGGDIGKLAACGTMNDLAMQAAAPRWLSLGLIIEEGLAAQELDRILESAAKACSQTGAAVVTGDTKVVERGRGAGLYINTAGIGLVRPGADTHVSNARPGDAVLISGSIGDHAVAVMAARKSLRISVPNLESDVAPLWPMIAALLDAVPEVRVLRDPTRGGLAAALCDIAEASGVAIRVRETTIPIKPQVRAACSLLGFDPLNLANEGKALIVCAAAGVDRALAALRGHPLGSQAALIGFVTDEQPGAVVLETESGGERLVQMSPGDELPRIC